MCTVWGEIWECWVPQRYKKGNVRLPLSWMVRINAEVCCIMFMGLLSRQTRLSVSAEQALVTFFTEVAIILSSLLHCTSVSLSVIHSLQGIHCKQSIACYMQCLPHKMVATCNGGLPTWCISSMHHTRPACHGHQTAIFPKQSASSW